MFTRWRGVGEMMTLPAKGPERKRDLEGEIEEQPGLSQISEQSGMAGAHAGMPMKKARTRAAQLTVERFTVVNLLLLFSR